jgi:hypothetical protein
MSTRANAAGVMNEVPIASAAVATMVLSFIIFLAGWNCTQCAKLQMFETVG